MLWLTVKVLLFPVIFRNYSRFSKKRPLMAHLERKIRSKHVPNHDLRCSGIHIIS